PPPPPPPPRRPAPRHTPPPPPTRPPRRGRAAWAFRRTGSERRASIHGRRGSGASKIRSLRRKRGR
ncbi:MAG: hypothetical protein F4X65_11185, partial [Chloroflexi bacterium]|nr:hypothetical protein [Chloroflexota bacterium]